MRVLAVLVLFAVSVFAQTCPEAPDGALDDFGKGIPPNPADIPTGCSDLEILVGRGTSEPNYEAGNGKFGIVVGDPVVSNTTLRLPGARGYPVQYPASSNIFGALQGATDVVNRLRRQSTACPNQKFALVGYSQGASLMHSAADRIPSNIQSKIVAVVMFGDPYDKRSGGGTSSWPTALRSKNLQICAPGDPVCDSGSCFYYHLTYIRPEYINKAVDFIVAGYQKAR